MACSHSTGCPLFPKLNASLRGWRDAYCDSDSGWQSCARYTQSLTGQSVPITLLPNGKYAHTMVRTGEAAATAARSRFESLPLPAAAAAGSPFEEAPAATPARVVPSVWDASQPPAVSAVPSTAPPAAPTSASRSAVPARRSSTPRSAVAAPRSPTPPLSAVVESPVLVRPAAPAPTRKPSTPPTPARAGWWPRLVEWMRGPA